MSYDMIRWGILGTSPISETMAKAIQESENGELYAVGSRSLATAEAFANQFTIPTVYSDYQSLLNDPAIDAIYIGLPNHLHKDWIVRAAAANKHILCEKPFVINSREAKEAFAAVQHAKVICMEAIMYRYHPFTHKLRELITSKIIGDIKIVNATYTADIADIANPTAGGSIRNLGCYPISLVRYLVNADPMDIVARGHINQTTHNDNQSSVILTFPNNVIATVSTADDIDMFWQFDIYGTEGRLHLATNPWLPERENNTVLICRHKYSEQFEIKINAEKSLYTYQIDEMNTAIMQGAIQSEQDVVTIAESMCNIEILESWLQQVKAHFVNADLEYVVTTKDFYEVV